MEWWIILLIVIGALIGLIVIFTLAISFYAASKVTSMLKRCDNGFKGMNISVDFYEKGPVKAMAEEGIKFMDKLGSEDLYISSFDSYRLHAYYFKNPSLDTKKFVLAMHGFKSGPRHEYAPYIERYFSLGFNLIAPDERSHYKSEGEYITMGALEKYDVLSWCNYIVEKFGSDVEILIQGISMGGATVCLSSSLDLPKNVIGIVSDCAYTSFKDQIAYTMKHNFKMNEFPIMNAIGMATKKIGLDFSDVTPKESVKNSKVPMIFMHGRADEMVPAMFAEELYEACGNKKELYIVDKANHAESMATNPDLYFKKIKDFFNL